VSKASESIRARYDVVILGAGHNGLVAACYLAQAGLSVLMLEKNAEIGGATKSARVFNGFDANLSIYAYLVSLFPQKIIDDLGLKLDLKKRRVASYTPRIGAEGNLEELLVSNESAEATRDSFLRLTGDDRDFRGYQKLQGMQECLARLIWPTLVEPMPGKAELQARLSTPEEKAAWEALIENPLGEVIEDLVADDLIRGLLFTDAKIGVSTWPHDPSLLQNRTFLYHIIGQGIGEWRPPLGGMGVLVKQLEMLARKLGVRVVTGATVTQLKPGSKSVDLCFETEGRSFELGAGHLLSNAPAVALDHLLGKAAGPHAEDEGSVFKINLLLKRLPQLRSNRFSAEDAFTGTFHIDEGYQAMTENYRRSRAGELSDRPACEIYCHSLTDHSILSPELAAAGYQTLTCFGIDAPYALFENQNDRLRAQLLKNVFRGLNRYLAEPIEDCLAIDANGRPCVEIKTPVDLENEIHLPRGNIFHRTLSWPFAEDEAEAGLWGVETDHDRILLCGSSAKRGGCVSGLPGHNAARKVTDCLGIDR